MDEEDMLRRPQVSWEKGRKKKNKDQKEERKKISKFLYILVIGILNV
jgi:hypothetical protein